MSSRNATIAFIAGAAIGSIVALLYAPQSGVRTRRKIRDGFDDAGEKLGDAGTYLRKKADRLNADAQEVIERTRSQVEDVLEEASKAIAKTLEQAGKTFSSNVDQAAAAISHAVGTATGQK